MHTYGSSPFIIYINKYDNHISTLRECTKVTLSHVADYQCRKFTREVRPLDGLPAESVVVNNQSLEVVNKLCYLGDTISAGGVEERIVGIIRCG